MTNLTNYCRRRRLPPRPRAAHRPQSVRFSFTLLLTNLFLLTRMGRSYLWLRAGRKRFGLQDHVPSLWVGIHRSGMASRSLFLIAEIKRVDSPWSLLSVASQKLLCSVIPPITWQL